MVVDADKAAGEGEYLAEGDQHAAVYHARRRNGNPRHQEGTAEEAETTRQYQLKMFHQSIYDLRIYDVRFMYDCALWANVRFALSGGRRKIIKSHQ